MNYVILEKAKPYTRVRRGKLERVRGYTGKPKGPRQAYMEVEPPMFLFHVSPTRFEETITKEGLRPRLLESPIEVGTEGPEPKFPVVYFGVSKESAHTFAKEFGGYTERMTVYKVKVPKGLKFYDDPYSYGEGMFTRKLIPASNLTIISRFKPSKRVLDEE